MKNSGSEVWVDLAAIGVNGQGHIWPLLGVMGLYNPKV